jgi:hypothetical protein
VDREHAVLHGILDVRAEPEREADVLVDEREQPREQLLQRRALAGGGARRQLVTLTRLFIWHRRPPAWFDEFFLPLAL